MKITVLIKMSIFFRIYHIPPSTLIYRLIGPLYFFFNLNTELSCPIYFLQNPTSVQKAFVFEPAISKILIIKNNFHFGKILYF